MVLKTSRFDLILLRKKHGVMKYFSKYFSNISRKSQVSKVEDTEMDIEFHFKVRKTEIIAVHIGYLTLGYLSLGYLTRLFWIVKKQNSLQGHLSGNTRWFSARTARFRFSPRPEEQLSFSDGPLVLPRTPNWSRSLCGCWPLTSRWSFYKMHWRSCCWICTRQQRFGSEDESFSWNTFRWIFILNCFAYKWWKMAKFQRFWNW